VSFYRSVPPSTTRPQSDTRLRPLAVALACALATPAGAAVITVDTVADGSLAGQCTLRDAVAAANGDAAVAGCTAGSGADVITFAAGLDTLDLNSASGGMLTISDALVIDGAGTLRTIRRHAEDAAFRILMTTKGTPLTLRWIKVAGGLANAQVPDRGGAGILAWGPLSLHDSEVSGNLTDAQYGRGGGINAHDTLTLVDSVITGNATTNQDASGGGFYAYADATLTTSVVSNNATAGIVAFGGGLATYPGITLQVSGSSVVDNLTLGDASYGGGIYAGGTLELRDSRVSDNATLGSDAGGGGLYAYTLAATGSTISGNRTAASGSAGGGLFAANVSLTNSTVSQNSTSGESAPGGGILFGVTFAAGNTTITGNAAAQAEGGGLFAFAFGQTRIDLASTIVFGNTGGAAPQIAFLDTDSDLIVAGTHNLIGAVGSNVQLPGGTLDCDPLLQPLAANGGATPTHALSEGSCAIDAGTADADLRFDQRGAPFVRDAGAAPDIGAFEVQVSTDDAIFVDGFESR
jgi:hypothetical protein